MFDIGFGELALVFVIGLVVLGPERLPVAVRTVVGWVKALRGLALTVQNEISQELKLQELQDSLKKVEQASKDNLSPELKASMEELREAADSMKKSFNSKMVPDAQPPQTIHNPLMNDLDAVHDGVTPADGANHVDAPAMAPSELASATPELPLTASPAGDEQHEPPVTTKPSPTGAEQHEPPVTTKPTLEKTASVPTPPSHNDR
ncbi:Sec-independent protein translocase protein TatB [Acerihabitans sp. TG2]|uniref:Sec-independent protein translocase protein TatB n=1 Tax=Acerihabitans sp. TG2 TaxID=3096008 RepID=UPI002B23DACD|nr:Sec-independent protein translocase protein TatB [Acerihabitans sp. TG2]MEA9389831.1 Sec-independent protein translocase protein TatB [Acerihabitans sp. TG2]